MLGYITAWFVGGIMLSCIYLLILETVEKQHFLECVDRYRPSRRGFRSAPSGHGLLA